jgi:hypothetical protein
VFFREDPAPHSFSLSCLICLALDPTEETQAVCVFVKIKRHTPASTDRLASDAYLCVQKRNVDGSAYIWVGIGKGVIPMVLRIQCPECGKGEKSEVVDVPPERRYRMKCGDCQCTYILAASADDDKKCEKPCKGCS